MIDVIKRAPGIGQSEIASMLGIKKGPIGKCLRRLVRQGDIRQYAQGRNMTYTNMADMDEDHLNRDALGGLCEFIRYYGELRKEVPKYGHQLKLRVNEIIYTYFTGLPERMAEYRYYHNYMQIQVSYRLDKVCAELKKVYYNCDDSPEIQRNVGHILRTVREMSYDNRKLVSDIVVQRENLRDIGNTAERGRIKQKINNLVSEINDRNECLNRIERDLLRTDRECLVKTADYVKTILEKHTGMPPSNQNGESKRERSAGIGNTNRNLDGLDLKIIRCIEQNPGIREVDLTGLLGEYGKNTIIRRCAHLAEFDCIRRHKTKGVTYAATECHSNADQTNLMLYYIDQTLVFLRTMREKVPNLRYYEKKEMLEDMMCRGLLGCFRSSIRECVEDFEGSKKRDHEELAEGPGIVCNTLRGTKHLSEEHRQVLFDVVANIKKRLHCVLDDRYGYVECYHDTLDDKEKKAMETKLDITSAIELDLNRDLVDIHSEIVNGTVDDALVDLMRHRHLVQNSTEFEDVIEVVDDRLPADVRDNILPYVYKIRNDMYDNWYMKQSGESFVDAPKTITPQSPQEKYQKRYVEALAMWKTIRDGVMSCTGFQD